MIEVQRRGGEEERRRRGGGTYITLTHIVHTHTVSQHVKQWWHRFIINYMLFIYL